MNSTLVVVTPAEVTALTTLERVKLELSIGNDASDNLLTAKILEASSDIAVRCDPTLRRETVAETFYSDRGGGFGRGIILRRYPVVTVSEVVVDGVALLPAVIVDDVVVDFAEYRFDSEAGLLYRQSIDGYACGWSFGRDISVTYAAGYLLPGQVGRNLPPSLEAACIELVGAYWAARGRDPMLKAETNFGVYEFQYWVGAVGDVGDLPPSVMQKIAPYRRRTVG